MKKILFILLLSSISIITACNNTDVEVKCNKNEVFNEESNSCVLKEIEDNNEVTKDIVLDAINDFRNTFKELGQNASDRVNEKVQLSNKLVSYTKDDIQPAEFTEGIDLEWLDMSIIVLDFAEIITNSSYVLGEETVVSTLVDDLNIWGWGSLDKDDKVYLNYVDEVLHLNVDGPMGIQTFLFNYNEDGLITLLRMDYQIIDSIEYIYIEDFVEDTGLSMFSIQDNEVGWYKIFTTYLADNDGLYTVYIDHNNNISFNTAIFEEDGIKLLVWGSNESIHVLYDLKTATFFDSFDDNGNFYLNETLLELNTDIEVRGWEDKFNIYTVKVVDANKPSLSIEELNINIELTFEEIVNAIDLSYVNNENTLYHYDYTKDVTTLIQELKELIMFEIN